MAVEARHLSLFQGQPIHDWQSLNPSNQSNFNPPYNPHMGFAGATLPEYQSLYRLAVGDSAQAKTSVNTDSGLTCNVPRKRQRDSANHVYAVPSFPAPAKQGIPPQQLPSSFAAGEDILPQLPQYHSEIDAIISQHNKKIRLELEERQMKQARLLAAAVGEGLMKKLREKDEQIQGMGKLNLALQERLKSLYLENQLWRDLAQSNEAAANSLRSNLAQVLLQVSGSGAAAEEVEDAESCCGSTGDGRDGERMCRMCGEREACVLLLPCRHLCLCGSCGGGGGSRRLQACPVCDSSMDATLHVNMTSS
ncbi:BOI-related E3 ubiquitin-protein ligase 1 [Striga hermonthica]|uniref:BOI-related E3 ubiquitin-protein ligase 1 n=1 Tax=Striga hermonthica TaxID=68872 RepID=A0A9N7N6J7_STRHE|nr:BOI-related E3 ubiquitin-protein ligase 1 [Striga hermonthica]